MANNQTKGNFKILEKYAELSRDHNDWVKQINLVDWGGPKPKLDIRYWSPDGTRPGRGETFNQVEARVMYKVIKERLEKAATTGGKFKLWGKQLNRINLPINVNCTIIEKIEEINPGSAGSRWINLVSWHNRNPKLDIRYWPNNNSHDTTGVTLDEDEARIVYQVLKRWFG